MSSDERDVLVAEIEKRNIEVEVFTHNKIVETIMFSQVRACVSPRC